MIDSQRAALSTVILVAATFEFGPVWRGILAWNLGLRYAYFVTAWLVVSATIYLCCTLFLRLRKPNLTRLTAALNLVGLTVVVTPLLLAAYVTLSAPSLKGSVSEKQSRQREITSDKDQTRDRPDIYFIILDAYGREDVLRERIGLDNSPFIERLRSKGFYVADRSTSNYQSTHLSLAATLNLTFLDKFFVELGRTSGALQNEKRIRDYFYQLVADSQVRKYLKGKGYHIMGNASNYNVTTRYFRRPSIGSETFLVSLSEFETTLLESTPLDTILYMFALSPP